jgi:hypothetical protein
MDLPLHFEFHSGFGSGVSLTEIRVSVPSVHYYFSDTFSDASIFIKLRNVFI